MAREKVLAQQALQRSRHCHARHDRREVCVQCPLQTLVHRQGRHRWEWRQYDEQHGLEVSHSRVRAAKDNSVPAAAAAKRQLHHAAVDKQPQYNVRGCVAGSAVSDDVQRPRRASRTGRRRAT